MAITGALPSMRGMYRAPPGYTLVHADYSQLELRVMAAVTGDKVLLAALETGDVYVEDAKDIFSLPSYAIKCKCKGRCQFPDKHVKPSARQLSKNVHLSFQYGAGFRPVFAYCLKQDRNVRPDAVRLAHERMRKRYARTVEWWGEEYARVKACGYSESRIMGRRRFYPREPPPTETSNYPIQSTAADIANCAMIELDNRLVQFGDEAGFEFQLHDAFDVECATHLVNDVKAVMKESMEQPVEIEGRLWTFPVEIKTGTYWNEV